MCLPPMRAPYATPTIQLVLFGFDATSPAHRVPCLMNKFEYNENLARLTYCNSIILKLKEV